MEIHCTKNLRESGNTSGKCPIDRSALDNPVTLAALRYAGSATRLVKTYRLLGYVIMRYSYDHMSLFVSYFDIAMGLGRLFQRIGPI